MQTLEIIRIYEQLLAQNPTYRKHLGAFYTQEWIVKYMVETACNELFKHKTYPEICQTTILDPCCGSGAF
ncbi:MAG: N-6 DNA methylase, partial [Raineya sp.]|nr:N-6 DNA methylase [Raineya sp.]